MSNGISRVCTEVECEHDPDRFPCVLHTSDS